MRILVATDFSQPSEQALDCARDVARQFDASVHLLYVVKRLLAEGLAAEASVSNGAAMRSDMVEDGPSEATRGLPRDAPR